MILLLDVVIRFIWVANCEAPNQLHMKRELLEGSYLAKYKVANKAHHIYRAASRLWAAGMRFETALQIVREAFDAATFEESP